MRIFNQFSGFIVRTLIAGLSWFPAGILALTVWAGVIWLSAVLATDAKVESTGVFATQIFNSFDAFIKIVRHVFLILITVVVFFVFPSHSGTWGMRGWKRIFPALVAILLIISVHEWYLAAN